MTTPNFNAMGHWWVGALAQFNFELEYQKGHDNTVADTLSQVTTQLDPDTVRSILNGVTLRTACQSEVHNPTVVKGDHHLEQEVHVTAGCTLVQMHITDWAEAQKGDLMLSTVLHWLKAQKKTDLKALLAEHACSKEGQVILQNWQNFIIHQGPLTVPCPCCWSASGGQAWPLRCNDPVSPVHIACNMRAICPKCLYTQLWPPLQWTSCM